MEIVARKQFWKKIFRVKNKNTKFGFNTGYHEMSAINK